MPRQRILTVDDDASVRRWIGALLRRLDVDVVEAGSGREALERAAAERFDLILLDVRMPELDGYAVADELARRRAEGDPGTPIIFLTGSDAGADKLEAFERGATDYVVKPFEPAELLARVKAVLRTQALVEQLEAQATTDRLTGLLNRQALAAELSACRGRLLDDPGASFAVLFLDLDRFKVVNDSLGHPIGDQLLKHVAAQLRAALGVDTPPVGGGPAAKHLIARNGGDEFVVILQGVRDAAACEALAERIRERVARPVELGGYRLAVGVSLGIRFVPDATPEVSMLLRDADTAMYRAKAGGRGRVAVFHESMHAEAVARIRLEHEIRAGIAAGQFEVHYQPIVSLKTNRLETLEALVRWNHPTEGFIGPDHFIPVAEDSGLITDLGDHVIELVCRQLAAWIGRFGVEGVPVVNVNVSPRQLHGADVCATLCACRDRTGVPLHRVGVELTESTLMQDPEAAARVLRELRALGVRLSIDDFGTGHSSMATLRSFPFDAIKIDRAFVQSMALDRSYGAVVNAIVTLAWNLNLKVVAEGVETAGELAQLLALEVDLVQGYLLSRPIPAAEVSALLASRERPFLGSHRLLEPAA